MWTSTGPFINPLGDRIDMGKREVYSRESKARRYDDWRFGGRSGSHVDNRERSFFVEFCGNGPVLDVACGTGRITKSLLEAGKDVVSSDYSMAMLKKLDTPNPKLRADAFSLPFNGSAFGTVTFGRFFQHYKELKPALKEASRVLIPGGIIVFDALKWSPRNMLPGDSRVYRHNPKEVRSVAEDIGMELVRWDAAFLFSPGLYRFLPHPLVRFLDWMEKAVPRRLRVRAFYMLSKTGKD